MGVFLVEEWVVGGGVGRVVFLEEVVLKVGKLKEKDI